MNNRANAHLVNWQTADWVLLDMDGTVLDLAFDNYFWRELVPQRYALKHGLSLDAARAELAPRFSAVRSEEHTSELQSLMRISYAAFCLKEKNRLKDVNYNYLRYGPR